jgi:predicted Zn-dependent protease
MEQLLTPENVARFLDGELTWAQISGTSIEQAYAMAELGYNLFTQGKLDEAEKIFRGLIAMNSKDPYFHSVLGSIFARQNKLENALNALDMAASLGPRDPHVFVNRAEIYIQLGKFDEALADLRHVLENDPHGTTTTHLRARAMAASTAQTIQLLRAQKDV